MYTENGIIGFMSSLDARETIVPLVSRFGEHADAYKNGSYNETQLRREFLDPFFEAFGWDVFNKQGYAEAYKDVVHEDAIKVGEATKAPDYCFRIGGTRKFFVEAKKPSVNIKDDISPSFQLRRYAWSAKLPLSILTDFEEFAVYDTRIRPDKADKASAGRILYLNYTEYLDRWEEIASIFSRDAVLKGSFDKYAEKGRKRGTAEVDDAFLKEIESWRELLAKSIANKNPSLSQRDLNFSVQRTIDRIVFLRIAEDRGIEEFGKLQALLNGSNVYHRLKELYRKADERYNSGLFHFEKEKDRNEEPDTLTPRLAIDDKPLKDILKKLYYPESPYVFSVLPADILGQVYEQFLGKVIRLTAGHQAKVEEKPEVRKAGGVYYTPTYIVEYIVKNTLGKLLEGKSPKEAGSIRVLDPACGSGSFLLGAYQYLLDWHLKWYAENTPDKWLKGKSPSIYQADGGGYRLTATERKRILLDNIYGVDIDTQAVEVTKLSLLLKVIEGESGESISREYRLLHARALPDLGMNIKCGNSLIGPDFYQGETPDLFDDDERYRINAFDWNAEFKEIMKKGGFDCVIGNPPYVRQESLGDLKEYLRLHYAVYHGTADLYAYFIEQGVSLLKENGLFGYIVSNKFMRANYGEPLRAWLKAQGIAELVDFGDLPVFKKATTYPCILITRKDGRPVKFNATRVATLDFEDLGGYVKANSFKISPASLDDKGWSLADEASQKLLEKIKASGVPLGEYVKGKIYYGIKTGLNEAFVIDEETRKRLIKEDPKSKDIIKPFLAGRDIKRYREAKADKHLILFPMGWTRSNMGNASNAWKWLEGQYPAIAAHLESFKEAGEKRCDQGEFWWELRACDYYAEFEKPKILYAEIATRGQFSLDVNESYSDTTSYIIASDDKYLLAILNSSLWTFLFSRTSSEIRGGFFRWKRQYMTPLPIRTIDFSNKSDKSMHDKMVKLVESMLDLNKKLPSARTEHDKTVLQRQIASTDAEIDSLVYKLYGLTDEEIAIVEGRVVDSNKENCQELTDEDNNETPKHNRALEKRLDPGGAEAPIPKKHPGTGKRVHGVRGRAGKPEDAERVSGDPEERTPTTRRTRHIESSLGIKSYSELAPDLARGVERVMASLIELPQVRMSINTDFVCGLHKKAFGELFPSWAGRYRDRDVTVGSYNPPPYYELPVLMRQYCDDLEARLSALGEKPDMTETLLETLAFAEGRFLSIHPFWDFNGRVARMLLFALLVRLDLPPVPLLPDEMNEGEKAAYLHALSSADVLDWQPLMEIWRARLG